nr:hypothetical protein DA06_04060 [Georgenia sp. SUBG003]
MTGAFLVAARHVVMSLRRWLAERRRLAVLTETGAAERVRSAVAAEQTRLAAEIQGVVRDALVRMQDAAGRAVRSWDTAPTADLLQVQSEGRAAITELRRLLGLLRQEATVAAPCPEEALPLGGLTRSDVVLAAVAVSVAAVEAAVAHLLGWPEALFATPGAVVLTLLGALTVVGRGLAPGAATLLLAVLHVAGTTVGEPVVEGLWLLPVVGPLAWACGSAERRTAWAVCGPFALVLALIHKHADHRPENLPIALAMVGVGVLGGVTVRLVRRHAEHVRRAAETRGVGARGHLRGGGPGRPPHVGARAARRGLRRRRRRRHAGRRGRGAGPVEPTRRPARARRGRHHVQPGVVGPRPAGGRTERRRLPVGAGRR